MAWAGIRRRIFREGKTQLIRSAQQEAEGLVHRLTSRMIGKVRQSSESTPRSIARGLDFSDITFSFKKGSEPLPGTIDTTPIEERACHALECMDHDS
jgi:hypothetical protein